MQIKLAPGPESDWIADGFTLGGTYSALVGFCRQPSSSERPPPLGGVPCSTARAGSTKTGVGSVLNVEEKASRSGFPVGVSIVSTAGKTGMSTEYNVSGAKPASE